MRILFCCELYAPSVGGVQEVMRQVAERLVSRGHDVTVATTRLPSRDFQLLNGVSVKEFSVSGNFVAGMNGEVTRYQDYAVSGEFDVILIKAAQQWTFDALWPVLDQIKSPKVFIPCGFSGLHEPAYQTYFAQMAEILRKFDHLIFYASDYRDVNFARQHNIKNFSIIPNGASEIEFGVEADSTFRARHDIPETSFVFLTVGSLTGLKGHLEISRAFARLELLEGEHATLILNGNEPHGAGANLVNTVLKIVGITKMYGIMYAIKHVMKTILRLFGHDVGLRAKLTKIAAELRREASNKHILITNFPRQELTQCYMSADLFVFASNVEYSPLVLFETVAAGTPFLSVNVGNAQEIAQWTSGGVLCQSWTDERGYTQVNELQLVEAMQALMRQKEKLAQMGAVGRRSWMEHFTWAEIARQYEDIFCQLVRPNNNIRVVNDSPYADV